MPGTGHSPAPDPRRHVPEQVLHSRVGDLRLRREKLSTAGTDGLVLVVYHADPGSPSADALTLLGSLAATATDPARPVTAGRRRVPGPGA